MASSSLDMDLVPSFLASSQLKSSILTTLRLLRLCKELRLTSSLRRWLKRFLRCSRFLPLCLPSCSESELPVSVETNRLRRRRSQRASSLKMRMSRTTASPSGRESAPFALPSLLVSCSVVSSMACLWPQSTRTLPQCCFLTVSSPWLALLVASATGPLVSSGPPAWITLGSRKSTD